MADKKNIVIKVKYPASGKMPEKKVASPKTISEWNVKRIIAVFAGIALVLTSLIYFLTKETSNSEVQQIEAASPEIKANHSSKLETAVNNKVLRAQLTTKVINNEPVDEITLPLKISRQGSKSIYYFVELQSMKGKTVYHEWLLDGVLISRKKVNISDETWRTSSRQVFNYTSENNWTVRLVDETGDIINEKHFNVIYE